jgi:hypothetical protein
MHRAGCRATAARHAPCTGLAGRPCPAVGAACRATRSTGRCIRPGCRDPSARSPAPARRPSRSARPCPRAPATAQAPSLRRGLRAGRRATRPWPRAGAAAQPGVVVMVDQQRPQPHLLAGRDEKGNLRIVQRAAGQLQFQHALHCGTTGSGSGLPSHSAAASSAMPCTASSSPRFSTVMNSPLPLAKLVRVPMPWYCRSTVWPPDKR